MSTQPLSIRFDVDLLERLRRRARTMATSPSTLAQQLVEEGMRMAEHPGIVFRDGPAGRRASLASGPDVWEVMAVVQGQDVRGEPGLPVAAEAMGLTEQQIRTAVTYCASHQQEVLTRIEDNQRAARQAHARWEEQQRLLA